MEAATAQVEIIVADSELKTTDKIELVLEALDSSEKALQSATQIDQMLFIRDKAQAIQYLTKKAHLARAVQNSAALLLIRAERKLGQKLQEMPRNKGAMGNPGGRGAATSDDSVPTYAELGITYREASRFQSIASLPYWKLDEFVSEVREADYELTVGGVASYAKAWSKKHGVTPKAHLFGPMRKEIYSGSLTLYNFIAIAKKLKEALGTNGEINIKIDRLIDQ